MNENRITMLDAGNVSNQPRTQQRMGEAIEEAPYFSHCVLVVYICYILLGSIIFQLLTGDSYINSLYFCAVTFTTVGYGDIVPNNEPSRIFAIFFILIGGVMVSYSIGIIMSNHANSNNERSKYGHCIQLKVYMLKTAFSIMISLIAIGTGVFYLDIGGDDEHEGEQDKEVDIIQSIYWAIITLTSVGYGDYTMKHKFGRIFASCFCLVGVTAMICSVKIFSDVLGQVNHEFAIEEFMKNGLTIEILDSLDENHDGKLDRSEFMAFILLKMGKADHRDINYINVVFDEMDTDGTGKIHLSDINAKVERTDTLENSDASEDLEAIGNLVTHSRQSNTRADDESEAESSPLIR